MKRFTKKVMFISGLALAGLCVGYSYGSLQTDLGKDLVDRLQALLKDPLLNLLSSSEFTDQDKVKNRIKEAEAALGSFKTEFDLKVKNMPPVAAPAIPVSAPVSTPVVAPTPAIPVPASTPVPDVKAVVPSIPVPAPVVASTPVSVADVKPVVPVAPTPAIPVPASTPVPDVKVEVPVPVVPVMPVPEVKPVIVSPIIPVPVPAPVVAPVAATPVGMPVAS